MPRCRSRRWRKFCPRWCLFQHLPKVQEDLHPRTHYRLYADLGSGDFDGSWRTVLPAILACRAARTARNVPGKKSTAFATSRASSFGVSCLVFVGSSRVGTLRSLATARPERSEERLAELAPPPRVGCDLARTI